MPIFNPNGQTFADRYHVIERIGGGGMGEVYKAIDNRLNREVAIKFLSQDMIGRDDIRRRFENEATSIAKLRHQHIIKIYDYFIDDDNGNKLVYFVMDYLKGGTLQERLERDDVYTPIEAAIILCKLCSALQHAHDNHIIHRDIKPSNIIFDEVGEPYIVDFGIVKLLDYEKDVTVKTQTHSQIGTPQYMSPEQVTMSNITPANDQYSLAVVLYQMLTGTLPYRIRTTGAEGTNPRRPGTHSYASYAEAHVQGQPTDITQVREDLPASLSPVIKRALSKRPEDRYSDMQAFCEDFFEAACNIRLTDQVRRRTPTLAIFAAALLGVMLFGILVFLFNSGGSGDISAADKTSTAVVVALTNDNETATQQAAEVAQAFADQQTATAQTAEAATQSANELMSQNITSTAIVLRQTQIAQSSTETSVTQSTQTARLTITATPTATATPTHTAMPTATATPTATISPTLTNNPTDAPQLRAADATITAVMREFEATTATQAAFLAPTQTQQMTETMIAAATATQAEIQLRQTATQHAIETEVIERLATLVTWTPTPTNTLTKTAITTITPTPTATNTPDTTATLIAFRPRNNADWTPVERDFDLPQGNTVTMVLVPAGCFDMGSNNGYDDEGPVHEICFDEPFWIDKYEVTNEQYGGPSDSVLCLERSSEPDHPRNCVTWFDARAFCQARSAEFDLPTEAQWEYAARGPDALVYPWGNIYDATLVIGEDEPTYGDTRTAPVGSRPDGASWVGALDLSGNLWEWISSLYEDYPYEDAHESNIDTSSPRMLRGGSFVNASDGLRSADRFLSNPDDVGGYYNYGFRCARSYSAP